jgi:hypothetical protein
MKTQIITETEQVTEIDWSKPMLVRTSDGLVILNSGIHETHSFQGCVINGNAMHRVGYINNYWSKQDFTPITAPVTIKFIPDGNV